MRKDKDDEKCLEIQSTKSQRESGTERAQPMSCHAMQMQMRIIDACVNVRSSRAIQRESAKHLKGRAEVQG